MTLLAQLWVIVRQFSHAKTSDINFVVCKVASL
jgi:hypothetical protein